MASMFQMQNTNMNQHVAFPKNFRPQSGSFGQVCVPKRTETAAGRQTIVAAVGTVEVTTTTSTRANTKTTASTRTTSNLAHQWREIQGSNNWENLVEPLHPLLRQEIIRYGDFVTACYKAFNLDPNSKRYLNCKYGKKNMFREVGLESCGYEVTKYIYATPDINIPIQNGESCGRWMGYVAVSSDDAVKRLGRRDIVITFRGTVTNPEWVANLMSSLTPARLDPHNPRDDVKVESGFLSLYTSDESESKFGLGSCREQLLSEVSRLLNKYKGEELSITLAGHSMGSSLALLLGYDIAELGLNRENSRRKIPITVFSFGGPRVGNSGFKQRCEELGVKVLRIVNVGLGGFVACRALSQRNDDPKTASRPWDKDRDGFVMGEGAGVLVMESLEHATKRGAPIIAEYLGGAINCDAYHMTDPRADGLGVSTCIERSLEDAGVSPEEVNYINAHATSTLAGDLAEINAIKKVFKNTRDIKINATKSMIGHCLGASGGLEAIATVKAITTGWLHPSINQFNPEPSVEFDTVANVKKQHEVNVAISNSFGFGGHNSVVAFSAFKP